MTFKALCPPVQRTHSLCDTKANQLMLYRETIAVCSEIRTEHINNLCGQNVELLNVTAGGIGAVESVHKTSDSDSFITAHYVLITVNL
jgi:hypothetical protein